MKQIYTEAEHDFCVGMLCKFFHYYDGVPSEMFPIEKEFLQPLEKRSRYTFLNSKSNAGYIIWCIPEYDKMKKNNKLLRLMFE
jgi:hypothetical protein